MVVPQLRQWGFFLGDGMVMQRFVLGPRVLIPGYDSSR